MRGIKLKGLWLILAIISCSCLQAQRQSDILGKLVDSKTEEPIVFASVQIKDKAIGVISNADGSFRIPSRFQQSGDTIKISCMGYENKELPLKSLSISQQNIIELSPGIFQLEEAVVSAKIKKLSAKQIVRIAVKNIEQNYPLDRFGLIGYYRDFQIKKGKYVNLNEAIVRVFDEGFGTKDNFNTSHQLYSYSRNNDFEIDSFAKKPYDYDGQTKIIPYAKMSNSGGNELATLSVHDPIRNHKIKSFSFVGKMGSDFSDNHRFKIRKEVLLDRDYVYEIDLSYRDKKYMASGKIYINRENFAIHKLDYSLFLRERTPQKLTVENEEERYRDGFKDLDKELLYKIVVAYAQGENDRMFLNYISFYNKFLIRRPAIFKSRFSIDLSEKCFRVRLNKRPWNPEKVRKTSFIVEFKDRKIPIDEIYYDDFANAFNIYPSWSAKSLDATYEYLFNETDNLSVEDLTYSYDNIVDFDGNRLDERKLEYLHQYREFFTQKVLSGGTEIPEGKDYIIKTVPLDSPLQPVIGELEGGTYWKNTPLAKPLN